MLSILLVSGRDRGFPVDLEDYLWKLFFIMHSYENHINLADKIFLSTELKTYIQLKL